MPSTNDPVGLQGALLKVVHGDAAWESLARWGVRIRPTPDGIEVDNPSAVITRIGERDIAQGMLRLRHDPTRLQEWARTLLAVSILVEINTDGSVYAERLLEELWELSEGHDLSGGAVAICGEIVASG